MEWRSMDTAPKDGTRVLLWRGSNKYGGPVLDYWEEPRTAWGSEKGGTTYVYGKPRWACEGSPDGYDKARAWMPLPSPPSEQV